MGSIRPVLHRQSGAEVARGSGISGVRFPLAALSVGRSRAERSEGMVGTSMGFCDAVSVASDAGLSRPGA